MIKITKKGISELDIFLKTFQTEFKDDESDALSQSKNEIRSLSQALEQSKSEVKSLKQIQTQSQKTNPNTKIKYVEKEIMDLSKKEMEKKVKRVVSKICDGVNMDEEEFSTERLDKITKAARDIIEYARE